jgi:endonuclease/exonuclease/phosphatase family metal-dependent hydrolase
MHLATLATVPVARARRIALPLLAEPRWRQAFNLKRALLEVEVPLADGRVLMVGNTHLSAFSRGDGTLPRQVAVLAAWMGAQAARGRPFVLAGDLNLLPPGDVPARLPDPENYADDADLVRGLLTHARSAVPAEAWLAPEWRSYQPYGSAPDRVLDYVFVSPDLGVRDVRVEPTEASDHLPLAVTLDLRG